MNEHYIKARDEWLKSQFQLSRYYCGQAAGKQGADWAYEWLTNPSNKMGAFSDSLTKIVDHQTELAKKLSIAVEALEKLKPLKAAMHLKTGTEIIDKALQKIKEVDDEKA